MNKTSYILSTVFVSSLFLSSCFASKQFDEDFLLETRSKNSISYIEEKPEFKGNWTEIFYLKDGSPITHTPSNVSAGFMTCGEELVLTSRYYNNLPMSKDGLRVKRNSTREEFIEALIKSGLYNSK